MNFFGREENAGYSMYVSDPKYANHLNILC